MKNPTSWNANDPERNWHIDGFFGLHYDLHAGAEDTELGAGLTEEYLRAELEKVQPDWVQCDCKGHGGYTSWPTEVGTPSPGIVKDALRIHRNVTRAMGIPLVMHYSGVWDNQAIARHPEWACIAVNGEAAGKEGFVTGATCNLSPYTRELLIPQMLELIEKYDVDGFWVDGENWATKPCYCARCTTKFSAETGVTEAPKTCNDPHWAEWAEFHRRLFEEHVRAYAEAVHARKPTCQVCSNWMYTVGHPSEIRVPVDYQSGDYVWVWSAADAELEARFLDSRRQLSWDLMAWSFTTAEPGMNGWTFKPADHLCQEAACVIALGGAFLVYDLPQRNGHLTNWHQDILADVARFVRARQPWCQHSESVPQAAVLHASSHYYAGNRDMLMAKWDNRHVPVLGAMQALLEQHCSVDVLAEQGLLERMASYALVVIPEQTQLSPAMKTALARYVQHGGRLWLTGEHVAGDFAELAGVMADGEAKDGYYYLPVGRESTTVKGPRQPVTLTDASGLYHVMSQQEPGFNDTAEAAVTLRSYGAGRVLAVHSAFFAHYGSTHYPRTRRLIGEMLTALSPNLLVEMDAPARLHLSLRRQPGRLIAHLVNHGASHPLSPTQVIVEEVPPIGPVTLRVTMPASPTRVYLAPSMEGLSWNWRDGRLYITVSSVGIMDSVVIE